MSFDELLYHFKFQGFVAFFDGLQPKREMTIMLDGHEANLSEDEWLKTNSIERNEQAASVVNSLLKLTERDREQVNYKSTNISAEDLILIRRWADVAESERGFNTEEKALYEHIFLSEREDDDDAK